jgi:type IV secretion system protein TrbE
MTSHTHTAESSGTPSGTDSSVNHLGRDWQAQSMQRETRDYVGDARPFCELLPWMFTVDYKLVVCKDSGLMACFAFTGPDADSTPDASINSLASQIEKAMKVFSDMPVVYWWQVHRRESNLWPRGDFQNEAAKRLDALRRAQMDLHPQYTNTHYVSILLLPPTGSDSLMQKMGSIVRSGSSGMTVLKQTLGATFASFMPFNNQTFGYEGDALGVSITRFESALSSFTASLPTLSMIRLEDRALGAFLNVSCSITQVSSQLALPVEGHPGGHFLDDQMHSDDLLVDEDDDRMLLWQSKDVARTQRYSMVQSVLNWPVSAMDDDEGTEGGNAVGTWPGVLDQLLSIDGELIITMVVRSMLQEKAQAFAQSMRKYHSDRRFSIKSIVQAAFSKDKVITAPVNTARSRATTEANVVASNVSMGLMQLANVQLSVQAISKDKRHLLDIMELTQRAFVSAGFKSRTEDMHALSAVMGHIPGNYRQLVRWSAVTTANVADVAMVRGIASGNLHSTHLTEQLQVPCDAALVLPTNYRTAYFLDIFAPMVGHGLFVGPTRNGKTVMGMLLASAFTRYKGAQVFCLDKDFSCRPMVLTHGGNYAIMDPDSEDYISCNPFVMLSDTRHHAWLARFVELLATQRGYVFTAEDEKEVSEAVAILASLDTAQHTLGGLYGHLGSERLKSELKIWIKLEDGSLARYFDNDTDGFTLSQVSGFELGKILALPQVAAPFSEMLFYRIDQHLVEQRLKGVVRPTLIYIPEVWYLLNNPVYAMKLVDWLKTLAKRNCAMWMDTQSLEDADENMSKVFAALRDNISNKIFVAAPRAGSDSSRRLLIREFGLSEENVAMLAGAVPRRDYLLVQGEVARQVQLSLSKAELAFLRSDQRAQIAIDRHYKPGLDVSVWLDDYLKEVSA